MKRRVVKGFTDKNTKEQYPIGSKYDTEDRERLNELVKKGFLSGKKVKSVEDATPKNKVETADDLKHVGGGHYELPNGEKIKGKDNALEALKNGGE